MGIGGQTTRSRRLDRRDPHERIDELVERMDKFDAAIDSITELSQTVDKIAKRVKQWGPILITAIISSGIFGEQWERFLSALVNG